MNEFDTKASGWDSNPVNWDRSKAIAEELIRTLPLNKNMVALEFGAGTGILSFMLKDCLKEIILMDSSVEMINVIQEKIANTKVTNLSTLFFDLEHGEEIERKFDLIFTQMVLHHVDDINKIIGKFSKMLNTNGYLVIADLYKEDGSFHGEGFTGHLGFDVNDLEKISRQNHFTNISHKECFVIKKEVTGIGDKNYPVFLLTAQKA